MKRTLLTGMAASVIALAMLGTPAGAQRGGGGGGGGMAGGMSSAPTMQGSGDLDRLQGHDRLHDRDTLRDGTGDGTPDRDRDQLHDRDRLNDADRLLVARNVDGQLSSWQLLTDQERLQYHDRVRTAATEQERERIRSEAQATIRERARNLGVAAPFGPERMGNGARDGYYLAQALTEQERLRFHERMRNAANEQERERIRTEMRTMARERAREMGVEVPAWYGN